MKNQEYPQKNTDFKPDLSLFSNPTIHNNTAQEVIIVTADRVKLCLFGYRDALKVQYAWAGPASAALAIFTTLVAAEFKTFLGFGPDVWKAIFVMSFIISSLLAILQVYSAWKLHNQSSVEYVIHELKSQSSAHEPSNPTSTPK